jgi:hypothetical protein
MTINHKDATGASLHEPKGVAAAAANNVYVTDGAGSGTHQKIAAAQINTSSVKNVNYIALEFNINDLSTAESHYLVCPLAGNITKIWSVIDKAIATADTTLTAKIATVAVTSGVITIAFTGSAAGDVDSATPSGANTVTAGQALEIACGGETNTTNAHAHITIEMDVS